MNNRNEKHFTPNYRQVRHTSNYVGTFGQIRTREWWTWEPMPLRADRKDLK